MASTLGPEGSGGLRRATEMRGVAAIRLGALVPTVVGLALVIATGTSLALWLASGVGERAERTDAARERNALVQAATERAAREVDAALGRLAGALATRSADDAAALAAGGSRAVAVAGPWGELLGLDVLEVVDPGGRVVSSAHWPERAGTAASDMAALPDDRAVWHGVPTPSGPRVALVRRQPIELAGTERSIVAGRFAAAVVTPLGSTVEARIVESSGAPGTRSVPLRDAAGRTLATVELEAPPEPPAPDLLLPAALAVGFATLGALGIALALRRAIARRVGTALGAIESVAAGEADYRFAAPAVSRLDALPGAWSDLHHELDVERRRALAAERVAGWREVARRVAHEVKNPLVPIRLTIENLVRARERAPEEFPRLFEDGSRVILEEVDRLRRLVGEFSEFSRLPAPVPRTLDIHGPIDDALALWAAGPDLAVERDFATDLPRVPVDPDLIARALSNVVANAVEATRERPGPRRLSVRTAVEAGWLRVEIADSGPGVDPAVADRIFEPYVTTKPSGTGLGLAIAQRIVVEHGGLLEIDARGIDGGARVVLRLPSAGGAACGEVPA